MYVDISYISVGVSHRFYLLTMNYTLTLVIYGSFDIKYVRLLMKFLPLFTEFISEGF